MEVEEYIVRRVSDCYWRDDVNCATTTLRVLSELYGISLEKQVLHSAVGLHGAGGFAAQCGLVEGGLLFIGILGAERNLTPETIVSCCYHFARTFEVRFGSLLCSQLRPEGFKADNPPHLCEALTVQAISFAALYVKNSPEFAGLEKYLQHID